MQVETFFRRALFVAFMLPWFHDVRAGVPCAEDFADVQALTTRGWTIFNDSQPVGKTSWHQGDFAVFPAQEGAADSYAAADKDATWGAPSLISAWLIMPETNFGPNEFNAKLLDFYTRAQPGAVNRLVVRQCQITAVETCDVPSSGLGGFTTVLIDINPNMLPNGYPSAWTEYYATPADGLMVAGLGRIAFHYYVFSQPDGSNGSYIGVDSVGITGTTGCPLTEIVFQADFD
jgi:hypothetical protein